MIYALEITCFSFLMDQSVTKKYLRGPIIMGQIKCVKLISIDVNNIS